ncbi:MAG: hypothetical protein ACRC78_14180, partial [Planktothrix sp.]
DRQLVALTFLSQTISNEADLLFLLRNSGKIIDYSFACADKFLDKADQLSPKPSKEVEIEMGKIDWENGKPVYVGNLDE